MEKSFITVYFHNMLNSDNIRQKTDSIKNRFGLVGVYSSGDCPQNDIRSKMRLLECYTHELEKIVKWLNTQEDIVSVVVGKDGFEDNKPKSFKEEKFEIANRFVNVLMEKYEKIEWHLSDRMGRKTLSGKYNTLSISLILIGLHDIYSIELKDLSGSDYVFYYEYEKDNEEDNKEIEKLFNLIEDQCNGVAADAIYAILNS
jgi:hypothetical protein